MIPKIPRILLSVLLALPVATQAESGCKAIQNSGTCTKIPEEDAFLVRAREAATQVKATLVGTLTKSMAQDGPEAAIMLCHNDALALTQAALAKSSPPLRAGRSSHRIRNPSNAPESWLNPYIDGYQSSTKAKPMEPSVHTFEDGSRVYIEPLYTQALCLSCHGTAISSALDARLKMLYPKDEARGFEEGSFRGVLWIREVAAKK